MKRLHINHIREVIRRLRAGDSERRIARDLWISRPTVHRYHEMATAHGWLDSGERLPDHRTVLAALGPDPQPPHMPSTLEPYRAVVQRMVGQQVNMTTIWRHLRDNHGYTGSYSSVRRFVATLRRHGQP